MDFTVEQIAKVAHETNRALCEVVGDSSQKPWDESQQWQKDSAIAGVVAYKAGGGLTPEEQHQSWLTHKEKDGWVYGPIKDAVAKTHPCMVPYSQLPPEQRIKDHLFSAVVREMTGL